MKNIYRIILTIVLSMTMFAAKSQNDGISMTLLPHLSYNNFYNPGISIDKKYVIGVGLSNVHFSVYNSSIRYNNLITDNDGNMILDANKFINSLDEHDNFINTNLSLDILRVGFTIGDLFVDLNWRMRYNGEFHYSRDFVGFFVNGNGNYLGDDNPADFSIGLDLNTFNEISVGLHYDINDKLSIGIRPKLLSGLVNAHINDDGTTIHTDENTYEMTANVNLNLQASTVFGMEMNRLSDVQNYFDSMETFVFEDVFDITENIGFGVDFGASYTFNKHFAVAAGVYDLGYIRWRDSKVKHNHKDNVVVNDAIIDDYNQLLNMDIHLEDLYMDFLEDVWDDDSIFDGGEYKTSLKTRIMLQSYYEFFPMARITGIAQMYYVKDKLRPAFTIAYSGSFFKFLNFTASYTHSKYSGKSIGAGVSVNLGPMNLYVVTDNLMILDKLGASPLEMATTYDSANVRFGLVATFGKKK